MSFVFEAPFFNIPYIKSLSKIRNISSYKLQIFFIPINLKYLSIEKKTHKVHVPINSLYKLKGMKMKTA